jgi:LPS O-antigen subunit length determinant protein (WzzB/FepE family)
MGINKPTTIDVLASSSTPPRTTPQTQVNVSNSTNSMTFLLGTEYLSSQIDILNSRADITQFILKIPELESQIKSAQNDTKILELQNRVSDDPYIDGLQQLFSQITALENDTKLTELKNRESDDPFIEILPQKLNELEILNHITFDFGEASIFQIDRAAAVDGIAEKPNRKLIIVLGTLLSGMLAMFIALIVSAANKRALRQES